MGNIIDDDAKVIVGDDYSFGHPAICRLSDTVMLAGHINDSDELEIHKSTDKGLNWTLKKSLPNASGCFNFAVISSTKVGLVYQKNDNEFEVWVSIDSGDNWTNKLDITDINASDSKSILLYDTNINRLHIVYEKTGADMAGKYSDNNGDSWTNWSDLSALNSGNIYDGDIDLITNNVYVCFEYTISHHIYAGKISSTGSYISSYNYGETGHVYHDVNFAVDLSGNTYFAHIKRNTTTSKEKLVVSRNEATEVDLYTPDTDNIIVKGSTSIGVDQDDNVFVYYTKTSDEKTYYRKYDAGISTWEAEVELIAVANNRINTEKHILALSNKLHFAYYQQPA